MVFNVTFNNISAISCRSALLVEETGVTGENHVSRITFIRYAQRWMLKIKSLVHLLNSLTRTS